MRYTCILFILLSSTLSAQEQPLSKRCPSSEQQQLLRSIFLLTPFATFMLTTLFVHRKWSLPLASPIILACALAHRELEETCGRN